VSIFLTAHQHNQAIQRHSRWFTLENRRQIKNTDNTQITYNSEKANNAKYSKTKLLPWFSRLL